MPGFKAAIEEGQSYSIMGAYNKFRGTHCSHSQYLLDSILREKWNYDGVVISDWGAVHDTKEAANSSLDIEMHVMSNFDEYYMANPLIEEVKKGEIDEKEIDKKISRILKLMHRTKMLEGNRKKGVYNTPEHRNTTLKVAREAVVLLKNSENLLPLNPDTIKSIAVIGENATNLHASGGDSAQIKTLYEIAPLMGIKMRLGGNVNISYSKGYSKLEEDKEALIKEAEVAASKVEVPIIICGLTHEFDTEGKDRLDMKLPFGHGLSYTEFEYSSLKILKQAGTDITFSFKVKNTGKVPGAEVTQIYISDVVASVPRPEKELKAFRKVFLKAGEEKEIEIELDKTALAFYNSEKENWCCEAGMFKILAGSSSRDLRLESEIKIETGVEFK